MTITSGVPVAPATIQDWLIHLSKRLGEIEAGEKGIGRASWQPAEIAEGLSVYNDGHPSWRQLNDGRIEIRGRLVSGAAITNGQHVLYLPLDCAPPNNDTISTSVSALAPCSSIGGDPGVVRVDVTRVNLATKDAVTAIIARPPESKALAGWIGFDHVIYDPRLYLDVLPPVEAGEEPLVNDPGIATIEYPDGTIINVVPGVKQVVGVGGMPEPGEPEIPPTP